MEKKLNERKEAWLRIIVAIVSGFILGIWKAMIVFLAIIHWVMVIFSGKRDKGIADFSEYWNTETYKYIRYLTFVSNKRPFPFSSIERMSKFDK